MGSTSNTSGSGTVSTLTGGVILAGVGITIVASGRLLQYVVYGPGRRTPAAVNRVNPGAEITGTGEPPLVQVQMNEIVPSVSESGGTVETTTDLEAADSTPANSEVQVEVVIEAPPPSSSHQTQAQYIMANVFTTAYHMVTEYVFSTLASGNSTF